MFCEITVDSWNDITSLFAKITDKVPDWAFRGQADETWDLSTKFEREARDYRCQDPYWFRNREKYVIQDLQRRAHQYIQNLPESENNIEWLSILQHHGGPTRFLDFSYSSYIALFFAVETAKFASAIWAVNIRKLFEQLSKITAYSSIEKEGRYDRIIKMNNQWADAVIKERKNDNVVFLVEPFKQHERISIQQGLFLFPGNIEMSFESNICSFFELNFDKLSSENARNIKLSEIDRFDFSSVSICKIVVPSSLHSKVLFELHNMNITSATLVPGFDGFARSLSYRFRELDYFINCKTT